MGPRGPKFERTEPRIDTDDLAAVTAEALLDLRHVNGRGPFPGADFEDVARVDPLQHAAEDFVLTAPAGEIGLVRGRFKHHAVPNWDLQTEVFVPFIVGDAA